MQDRIFQDSDQQWYYRIRGNDKVGPFASRLEAELKLEKQILAKKRNLLGKDNKLHLFNIINSI